MQVKHDDPAVARGLILIVLLLAPQCVARAEITIDDFNDPFKIMMPDMNRQYQTQINVGALAADRLSQGNACCASRPTGQIDANLTSPSELTISIDRINPDPLAGAPAVSVNVLYFFDPTDVTQGGSNDRVVVDFTYLRSLIPMAEVDVFMQDNSDDYVSQQFHIAPNDGPFEMQFPFDTFAPRGGGVGSLDPAHIEALYFTITPVFFTPIDQIDFSTAVGRIRFANVIPEPTSSVVAFITTAAAVVYSVRKRRFSVVTAVLLAGVFLTPNSASADVVLDDFDDPFQLVLPHDISSGFNLQQSSIGPLSSTRLVGVSTLFAMPIGQADANITRPSAVTLAFDRLNRTAQDLTIVELGLQYLFNERDVSEGGLNDRVDIDFGYLRSAAPLARVDVFIWESSHPEQTYVSELYNISPHQTPFTLQFPLNSFGDRGGGSTPALDPQHVNRVLLSIYPVESSVYPAVEQLNFSTAIERVRFSNTVPEPSASSILAGFILLDLWFSSRNRRSNNAILHSVCSNRTVAS